MYSTVTVVPYSGSVHANSSVCAKSGSQWSCWAGSASPQRLFCMKSSMHEILVVKTKWSLTTAIGNSRFLLYMLAALPCMLLPCQCHVAVILLIKQYDDCGVAGQSMTAGRSGGGALWRCAVAVACCYAVWPFMLLGHHHRVLSRSCCQHFPWYSLSCYTHFCQAMLPLSCCAAAVILPCRCACCLPMYMQLTTVLPLCHCHTALPAMVTVRSTLCVTIALPSTI